jgi:hypothetical protein
MEQSKTYTLPTTITPLDTPINMLEESDNGRGELK